jgi:hypothetical protein
VVTLQTRPSHLVEVASTIAHAKPCMVNELVARGLKVRALLAEVMRLTRVSAARPRNF